MQSIDNLHHSETEEEGQRWIGRLTSCKSCWYTLSVLSPVQMKQALQFLLSTALVLRRLRTCSASLTASAESWAYSYPAFIVGWNMSANMHFPGQDWCLTYCPELTRVGGHIYIMYHVWDEEPIWNGMKSAQQIAKPQRYTACLLRWILLFLPHKCFSVLWVGSWSKALIFRVSSSTEVTASAAWTPFEVNCSTSVFR